MRSKSAPIGTCTTRTRRSPKNGRLAGHGHAHFALHGGEKILLIAFHLKRDQIVGEQALQQLAAPRTDAQSIDIRPGNVPEERGPEMRPLFPQVSGNQRQVVVVQEDGRVLRRFRGHDIGEAPVHRLIRLPVFRVELRLHVRLVTERPERAVREAGVVPLYFLARQPDSPQPVRRRARRHVDRVPRIDDDTVGGPRTMRDPDTTALAHHRVERD
jgi:hypothetical protein